MVNGARWIADAAGYRWTIEGHGLRGSGGPRLYEVENVIPSSEDSFENFRIYWIVGLSAVRRLLEHIDETGLPGPGQAASVYEAAEKT